MLLLVFLIGILFRLLALNFHDFWFDEAITYHFARLPVKNLLEVVLADNNPPLYYLLIHYLVKISPDELILRLPSLLANLLSILALYHFVKTKIDKRVATVSASLFAVSPLSIYLATEARLHSLALLFVTLIINSFFKLLTKPSPVNIAIFIFFTTLGLYTQYYIILLLLPLTYIIYSTKNHLTFGKWLTIASIPLLTLVPWLILSTQTPHSGCWCPNTLLSLPASLVAPTIAGVGNVTMRTFPNLPPAIFALFLTTSLLTFVMFVKGIPKSKVLPAIYLIPLAALSTAGLFFPVFSPKAFSITSPIYFIIVSLGITSFSKKYLGPLIFLLLTLISAILITNPFFRGEKLKEASEITSQRSAKIIAHTSILTYYPFRYYLPEHRKNIMLTANPLTEKTVNLIGGQKESAGNLNDFWLVEKRGSEYTLDNFTQAEIFAIGDISVKFMVGKSK
ncbi:glycosyltransferase family 39 protein [Candidatus Curtissbacteria bacterium]|nr:glycosyltransferase family 39 protein [Candidatus Curtissbacteria bacterium]